MSKAAWGQRRQRPQKKEMSGVAGRQMPSISALGISPNIVPGDRLQKQYFMQSILTLSKQTSIKRRHLISPFYRNYFFPDASGTSLSTFPLLFGDRMILSILVLTVLMAFRYPLPCSPFWCFVFMSPAPLSPEWVRRAQK